MKKQILISCLAVLVMMFIYGCEEATKKPAVDEKRLTSITPPETMPAMPTPSGGLVLSIESSAVTADEIIKPVLPDVEQLAKEKDFENFKIKARPLITSVLVEKVADIKLYQKAKAALPEGATDEQIDKIVDEEVQKFIARCGGNYSDVEKLLAKMGTTWPDFYKQQKRAMLVQAFVSEEIKDEKPITHSELLAYYNQIKEKDYENKAQTTVRVIDIKPYALQDGNDPNANLDEKASKLASEIYQKIKTGADFNELAKKYSQDFSAADGGLWKPFVPGTLAKPFDVVDTAAQKMTVGQIGEPIITRDDIFIVKLVENKASNVQPFEKVQSEVEARMLLEKRKKTVDDMMNKIIAQVDLTYADQFVEYCVEKAYVDYKVKTMDIRTK